MVGDIGGTNLRLAVISFTKHSQTYEIIIRKTFETKNLTSVEDGLK